MNDSNCVSKNIKWIDFIILCSLIRPHPTIVPDVVSVYFFDVVIIAVLFAALRRIYINKTGLVFFALLTLIVLIKNLAGLGDVDTWLSLFKILFYILVFTNLKLLIEKCGYNEKNFDKVIKFCYIFNVVICIIQLLDLPVIGTIVHLLYGQYKLRSIWGGYPRIYGTFYNANWFGVYLIFMVSYFTFKFCKNKNLKLYITQIVCSVGLLLISGSRTSLLGSVLAIVLILLMNGKIGAILKVCSTIGVLFAIGMSIASKISLFAKTLRRFTSYFDILFSENGTSISAASGSRWAEWVTSWNYYMESPILGNVLGEMIPHNTYIAVLIRFGFIGALVIIVSLLAILLVTLNTKKHGSYFVLCVAFIAALLLVMMSGDYLFTTQIMLVLIILLCINNAKPNICLLIQEGEC